VSRPTLPALVDGLEHPGLVKRTPKLTDRRGIRLELTEAECIATERVEIVLTKRLLALAGPDSIEKMQRVSPVVEELNRALDQEFSSKR
jgi:DNA-binding MarR family transcriptional regulator